jgi:inosose dehydratase
MDDVGLAATESGPEGFLPPDPDAMAAVLAAHGLTAVGGFTPVVLHERTHDPLPAVERLGDGYAASGAATLVLSAATGRDDYDSRPDLDELTDEPVGEGPAADVHTSAEHLRALLTGRALVP